MGDGREVFYPLIFKVGHDEYGAQGFTLTGR